TQGREAEAQRPYLEKDGGDDERRGAIHLGGTERGPRQAGPGDGQVRRVPVRPQVGGGVPAHGRQGHGEEQDGAGDALLSVRDVDQQARAPSGPGQQGAGREAAGRQGPSKRRLRGRGAAAARGNPEEGGVHRDHGGESPGGVRQA
ncbi:unnamed protein product, partial [Ectocarpus fasciculatus]